ncbi:MAG: F0F1 ATP synthase subunit delta [Actinobacteria bacterium]|nr:F0F1 ATP synthase subunit delta [Actinomycetota bacterium]MCB9413562.1 F0F1 ATP synthase subunit delta [Actinomycetota bacterium]
MLGASRISQQNLRESLDAIYDDPARRDSLAEAGTGVLSVVDAADRERSLRSLWSDTATADSVKEGVLAQLFGSRVPELTTEVVGRVITSRWSNASDMMDAMEESAASLLFMAAEVAGRLDTVEEELFRFDRSLDASPELQMALSNPATPPEAKVALVQDLLDGKSDPITEELLVYLAGHLHGRHMSAAVTQLSALAAVRRGRVVAEVTSAIELTEEQKSRLTTALSNIQGRQVLVNVTVDPNVIGGIQVRVGDEVIDGTLATRIEQARRRLTS